MAPSKAAGTPKKAASKKKSKLKARKSTEMKNSSSAATLSTVRKKKKSKKEEEPAGGLKLLKRNCVAMKRISNRNSLGRQRIVQFNRKGIPYGKVAQEMQSYIGVLARKKIPIVRKNWRTASLKNPGGVTAEEKNKLWERVQIAFVIGDECKKMVFKSASAKWREFKSRLTSWYIVPYLNEPEKMKYPPQDYKFISQDHWTQFVADRTNPSFLTLRKIQQMKRKLNMYPHRLSRKGYAGLEEELLRAENLTDDEELERFFMWIEARKGKNGTFKDDATKKKAEEILQLKEKVDRGEESISGSVDVLEKALGTKEQGGRVRGVGGYITPSTYFHHPRRKRATMQETIKINVEAYIAEIKDKIIAEAKKQAVEEFKAQLMEDKQQPGNGGVGQAKSCPGLVEKHLSPVSGQGSCSLNYGLGVNEDREVEAEQAAVGGIDVPGVQQEKEVTGELAVEVPKQVDAEARKLESKGQNRGKLSDEVIRQCIEAMDHKEVAKKKIPKRKGGEAKSRQKTKVAAEEVMETEEKQAEQGVRAEEVAVEKLVVTPLRRSPRKSPKNIATVEVPVLLAVGSLENIVGTGTVLQGDPNQLIHGVPLGEGNVRVSVSVPKQENAKVPFPVSDEIVTVRQACGSWVAWPEELVIYMPLSPSEKPNKKRRTEDKDFLDVEDFHSDDEDTMIVHKVFDSKLLREVAAGLPNSLSMLCMWGEEGFKDDKTIQFDMEPEVFGEIRSTYIFGDDVLRMATMKEVTGNIIVIYQRYLYDVLKKYQMLDMFAFVDPAMIGEHKACGPTKKKVEYLSGRLKASQPGQLMMVAYNADEHWVLTIIDPQNEKVYYLDPIRRRLPLGSCEWKTIVNSAVGKYNEYMGRTSLKAVEWKPLTGIPHQPNAVECGYYVMRYMRDIVEDKDQSNFVTKWSRRDCGLEYTQDDLDVVRNEWAKFIVSTCM